MSDLTATTAPPAGALAGTDRLIGAQGSTDVHFLLSVLTTFITGTLGSAAPLDIDTDGTLAANSDAKIATQKAVKTAIAAAVTGLWDLKGDTDCSANPNYPVALKGDAYVVTVAGKIGGASGTSVDIGDVYVAKADNAGGTQAAVGTSWSVLERNLAGALLAANNLSDIASAPAARTNLGLEIGLHVQAYAAALATLASSTAAFLTLSDDADVAAMRATLGAKAPDIQAFTSNGTWTKPSGAVSCKVIVVGGGGGGGGGARGAAGVALSGGAGGGGAFWLSFETEASALGSTEAVTVGAAGSAGAGATVDGAGTAATAGGNSAFGSWATAWGGGGGAGGGVATASGSGGGGGTASAGGTGVGATVGAVGNVGGAVGTNTGGTNGALGGASGGGGGSNGSTIGAGGFGAYGGGGGGCGGGITTADAQAAGGTGGRALGSPAAAGGTAGTTGGGNGGTKATSAVHLAGAGGGGGGSATAAAGGTGGAGQTPGGGAGGGGAARTGANAGAGGAGGGGVVVAISYF